jgi:hypothetical protein
MKTHRSAVWQGGIKDGKGAISTKSGTLKEYPYGFSSRFEGKPGTNPEKLIGTGHAGCFTMALSADTRRGQAHHGRGHARWSIDQRRPSPRSVPMMSSRLDDFHVGLRNFHDVRIHGCLMTEPFGRSLTYAFLSLAQCV